MTNKINIVDNSEVYHPKVRLTTRAKRGLGFLAAGTTLVAVGPQAVEAMTDFQNPDMHGTQLVPADSENKGRVDLMINQNVDGGTEYTGTVRAWAKNNPNNAEVLEDGIVSGDEELELPEKVTD